MSLRVLHVVPTFWPATYWGGPIFSTKAICDGLAWRDDLSIRVLTTDSAGPSLNQRIHPDASAEDHYPVLRTRRIAGASVSPELLWRLRREILWSDVVHVTSTYSFPTLPALAIARLARRPVVWSPRGALQATADWADAPSRGAKNLFEQITQYVRPRGTVLHVTSAEEGARSVANLRGIETKIIPNSVDVPDALPRRFWRPDGELRLLFLGRLHPKKGIELLLRAMDHLPGWVRLDIYGDGDPDYVAGLRALCLPDPRIRVCGPVAGTDKTEAFLQSDVFVLPSWSENFGIAVAEALAHGVPVITTNRTPWREVETRGCGLCIDPEKDDLGRAILSIAQVELPAMGQRGRDWMQSDFSPMVMCNAFETLYRRLAEVRVRENHA